MTRRILGVLLAVSLTVVADSARPVDTPPSGSGNAVRAIIIALFDGMRTKDPTVVRAVFHEEARLHTRWVVATRPLCARLWSTRFVDAVEWSARRKKGG